MAGNQVNDIILQAELHKTTFSMRLIPAITAAAALALTACSTNSVTISYEGGKTRVEAYSDNILRVTSVPEGADIQYTAQDDGSHSSMNAPEALDRFGNHECGAADIDERISTVSRSGFQCHHHGITHGIIDIKSGGAAASLFAER